MFARLHPTFILDRLPQKDEQIRVFIPVGNCGARGCDDMTTSDLRECGVAGDAISRTVDEAGRFQLLQKLPMLDEAEAPKQVAPDNAFSGGFPSTSLGISV